MLGREGGLAGKTLRVYPADVRPQSTSKARENNPEDASSALPWWATGLAARLSAVLQTNGRSTVFQRETA